MKNKCLLFTDYSIHGIYVLCDFLNNYLYILEINFTQPFEKYIILIFNKIFDYYAKVISSVILVLCLSLSVIVVSEK